MQAHRFSERTDWISRRGSLAEAELALKVGDVELLDLVESNPTKCGFKYLEEPWLDVLTARANLVYEPDPKGLPEAREAICGYYRGWGIGLSPEQIIITSGTSEAYGFLFRLLANAGERILAPAPGYPLLDFLARINDVGLDNYRLAYGDRWEIAGSNLVAAVRPDTKAITVIQPHNPTGHVVSPVESEELIKVCEARSLALVSDEVFFDYIDAGQCRYPRSFAGTDRILTFTLSGLSKVLGLPQMKLSWIVVNGPEAMKREALNRLEIIADTLLSVNTPVQRATRTWLEHRPAVRDEIATRVAANRASLAEHAGRSGRFRLLNSEGGWYAVLRLDPESDDEQIAAELLSQDHVVVHPGCFFDFDAPHLVLSLIVPPKTFDDGVHRLVKRLQKMT